jgi:hypothetical protein
MSASLTPTTDDLANAWATRLTTLRQEAGERTSVTTTNVKDSLFWFEKDLNKACRPFLFWSALPSGSLANKNAVDEALSVYDNRSVQFATACGSYVSGNSSQFQAYATSSFDERRCLSMISEPANVTDLAKQKTLPFPYTIPNRSLTYDKDIDQLENDCLIELQTRFVMNIITKSPIKVILIELMLGGCGGILRYTFLKKLGSLAKAFGVMFVVDEIFTGGRTGSFLLSQETPPEFLSRIDSVTIGKWLGVGIVLRRSNPDFGTSVSSAIRGESTIIDLWNARAELHHIVTHLEDIPLKREKVLKQLKLTSQECWGKGIVIFGPIKLDEDAKSLKCRYTPLLDMNVPIDDKGSSPRPILNYKVETDENIRKMVRMWINHSENLPQYMIARDVLNMVCTQEEKMNQGEYINAFVSSLDVKCPVSVKKGKQIIKSMVEEGLLLHRKVGSKRKRVLVPAEILRWFDSIPNICVMENDDESMKRIAFDDTKGFHSKNIGSQMKQGYSTNVQAEIMKYMNSNRTVLLDLYGVLPLFESKKPESTKPVKPTTNKAVKRGSGDYIEVDDDDDDDDDEDGNDSDYEA